MSDVERGFFIVLEGGEGAGKSTAREFVRESLERMGKSVVVTREPGGTALGESLREMLLSHKNHGMSDATETLMMFAARAEHLHKVILPALDRGEWVLCDRFTSSTYAYQSGGRGIPPERIAVLEQWVQGDVRPDMTILMDIDVAAGLERAGRRGALDRFESEEIGFLERVRQNYLEQAGANPDRFAVVDASLDIDSVKRQLLSVMSRLA